MEIVEGPLFSPRRLEEAFVVTKFGRRLMHFLHPRNRGFSDIRATRVSSVSSAGCGPASEALISISVVLQASKKWTKLLHSLISTLLATPEGIKILLEDKLLRQLVECFSELDQYAGQPSPHPFFSKNRVETTLSKGYFDVIGIMSEQPEGMR